MASWVSWGVSSAIGALNAVTGRGAEPSPEEKDSAEVLEEMRQKRLAALAGSSPAPPESSPPEAAPAPVSEAVEPPPAPTADPEEPEEPAPEPAPEQTPTTHHVNRTVAHRQRYRRLLELSETPPPADLGEDDEFLAWLAAQPLPAQLSVLSRARGDADEGLREGAALFVADRLLSTEDRVPHATAFQAALAGGAVPPAAVAAVAAAAGDAADDAFRLVIAASVSALASGGGTSVAGGAAPWPALQALRALAAHRPLAALITRYPTFAVPAGAAGRGAEAASLLGLLLRVGLPAEAPELQAAFGGAARRTQHEVDAATDGFRGELARWQDAVGDFVLALLKAGPAPKEAVLAWFAQTLELSAGRATMQAAMQPALFASDALALNACSVLCRVCAPFLPVGSPKSALISPALFAGRLREFPDEARLGPDEEPEPDHQPGELNFVSRVFALALRALHLGPLQVAVRHKRLNQQLAQLQAQDPAHPMFAVALGEYLALECALLDPAACADWLRLAVQSADWLVRAGLPARTPQHVAQDVADLAVLLGRAQPLALDRVDCGPLLTFMIELLGREGTPHLRAAFSDMLWEAFLPEAFFAGARPRGSSARCAELLGSHPRAREALAPSLLTLYGDVEQTGFYEKLGHRFHIARVLRYLWELPAHRATLTAACQGDAGRFVRFAHGLMNHTNALVADIMEKLPEIAAAEGSLDAGELAPGEAREQLLERLRANEESVTGSLQLANETIAMLRYLTSEPSLRAPFMLPELKDRFASLVCSILGRIVGSRATELKVRNPAALNFFPRDMLRDVLSTVRNFAAEPEFAEAVVACGLYRGDVFRRAPALAAKMALLAPADQAALEALVAGLGAAEQAAADAAVALDDAPEEFLDALLFSVMSDPVRLPSSGVVVDRGTILQHLMNDPTDPFNRSPLAEEELEECEELRGRIESWVGSRSSRRG